jgi:hypothetical protein
MPVLKGITPTPAQVKNAYQEAFGPAIREAAGKDGRISPQEAARMAERADAGQLVADNLANFFERTGQKSVSAEKFVGVVGDYAARQAERHAGTNQRLSLVEIRNLPDDLVGDLLHLRGKDDLPPVTASAPRVKFNENDLYAFLYPEQGDGWQSARSVTEGAVKTVGVDIVVDGLTDVGDWQGAAEKALQTLWPAHLVFRAWDGEARIGPQDNGTLEMGPVVNDDTGEAWLLVFWRDIDDGSHAWFYTQSDDGSWQSKASVFLN